MGSCFSCPNTKDSSDNVQPTSFSNPLYDHEPNPYGTSVRSIPSRGLMEEVYD